MRNRSTTDDTLTDPSTTDLTDGESLVRALESLRTETARLRERVETLESETDRLREENAALREENEALRERVEELECRSDDLESTTVAIESTTETLESESERLDGRSIPTTGNTWYHHAISRTFTLTASGMSTVRRLSALRELPAPTAGTLLLVLFSLPALSFASSNLDLGLDLGAVVILYWLVALVVVGLALGVESASLASIGVRRPAWIDLGYLVATAAVAMAIFVFAGPLLESLGLSTSGGTAALDGEPGLALALAWAVTVGIVEELLYRGYAIERLLQYTNSPMIAGGLTWVAFTLAHVVTWPIGNVIQTGAVTAVFIVVYLRRRTLVPVVGAHASIWVLAVLGLYFA